MNIRYRRFRDRWAAYFPWTHKAKMLKAQRILFRHYIEEGYRKWDSGS